MEPAYPGMVTAWDLNRWGRSNSFITAAAAASPVHASTLSAGLWCSGGPEPSGTSVTAASGLEQTAAFSGQRTVCFRSDRRSFVPVGVSGRTGIGRTAPAVGAAVRLSSEKRRVAAPP